MISDLAYVAVLLSRYEERRLPGLLRFSMRHFTSSLHHLYKCTFGFATFAHFPTCGFLHLFATQSYRPLPFHTAPCIHNINVDLLATE